MIVTGLGQSALDCLVLVDTYPEVDTKKEVIQWHEQGGGPVATALVALSRLGISCGFHGIIGDDYAGEKIRQSLIEDGIDVTGLIKRDRATSQIAFIVVEKGSITISNDEFIQLSAFRVEAVDTTGAGDVFHGGYIYGLLNKWSLKDAVTFASALAAIKCTKIGGRIGIPGLSEVRKFLAEK